MRYTIYYTTFVYTGDSDYWNSHDFPTWEKAIEEYNYLTSVGVPYVSLRDNEYSVTLHDGEWY